MPAQAVLQSSAWKRRRLAGCRAAASPAAKWPAQAATAWRCGWRLGLRCVGGCAGFTAALLAVGVMDWRAMLLTTAAIGAERLLPDGGRIAKASGVVLVATGLALFLRACTSALATASTA